MQGYAILYIYQEKGYTMKIVGFLDIHDQTAEGEEGFAFDEVLSLCPRHADEALGRWDTQDLGDELGGTCDGCRH